MQLLPRALLWSSVGLLIVTLSLDIAAQFANWFCPDGVVKDRKMMMKDYTDAANAVPDRLTCDDIESWHLLYGGFPSALKSTSPFSLPNVWDDMYHAHGRQAGFFLACAFLLTVFVCASMILFWRQPELVDAQKKFLTTMTVCSALAITSRAVALTVFNIGFLGGYSRRVPMKAGPGAVCAILALSFHVGALAIGFLAVVRHRVQESFLSPPDYHGPDKPV